MIRSVGEYEFCDSEENLLGEGSFGKVYKGWRKTDHTFLVAIKVITIKSRNDMTEIDLLRDLKHTNIVELLHHEKIGNYIYIVMEMCHGDLESYVQGKILDESTIRDFTQQIAAGMRALKEKGILHRDLKPANILLTNSNGVITLKIADFGLARLLRPGDLASTLCGSFRYMAPEIVLEDQKYGAEVDLWSIGVILFRLLTSTYPYIQKSRREQEFLYSAVRTGNFDMHLHFPNGTSAELMDLIDRLLQIKAGNRMTFEEFFNHAFIRGRTCETSTVCVGNENSETSTGSSTSETSTFISVRTSNISRTSTEFDRSNHSLTSNNSQSSRFFGTD